METSLAITTQERPQHAMARREAADPLAEILAGQLSEHTRRAYRHDLGHLLAFLDEGPALAWRGLTLAEKHELIEQACAGPDAVSRLLRVSRADLIAFGTHLKRGGAVHARGQPKTGRGGHSDPRTTERDDRARENLADNAADYVARVLGEVSERGA